MDKNEECKRTDQLDPGTRNLVALQAVSAKLGDVSKALNQCQVLTNKLAQVVDGIAKNYAALQVKNIMELDRLDEQFEGSKDE